MATKSEVTESVASENETSKVSAIDSNQVSAPARSSSAVAWVALLVASAALAATGFSWYQAQIERATQQSSLVSDIADIGASVTLLGDRVQQIKSREDGMLPKAEFDVYRLQQQTQFEAVIGDVAADIEPLQQEMQDLQLLVAEGARDYRLNEVGELLKAANLSASVLANKAAATNALHLADEILRELDDPSLLSLRQALLAKIEQFKAINAVDMNELSARVQGLVARIPELDLKNEPAAVEAIQLSSEADNVQPTSAWDEFVQDIQDFFKIRVQQVDASPVPLLSPEQRYFLDLNLSLALNKAELAALQKHSEVYASSLTQARSWVVSYYDVSLDGVQGFLRDIDALSQESLATQMPELTDLYRQYQSARER